MAGLRVVAFGNPAAGDDAAGLVALAWARARLNTLPGVEVIEAGPGIRALELLEGADAVVAVDAVHRPVGERRPGRLVRAQATAEGLGAELATAVSSHGFGLADAIALANALGHPTHVVFVGVEVADVTMGRPLSPQVSSALPGLVRMILDEVAALLASMETAP